VSGYLEHDQTWRGALHALVVFVPVYWVWVGVTIQADVHDLSGPLMRIVAFLVALGGMFMALAIPDAYGSRGTLFAGAYWASRVAVGIPWFRDRRWTVNPVTVSMTVTGPLLLVGAFVHGDARLAVWAAAAVIDLSTPTLLRRRLRSMSFDAVHLAERFGLFVLIAIGESVVTIGVAAQATGPLTVDVGLAVVAAFAVSCGLWWVYFHFAADAVRHALATAPVQLDITRLVLSYGHLSFIAAIIATSVGMREAVNSVGGDLSSAATLLLFGGTALYLATFGYTRWMMFRLVSWTRLSGSVAVLALLAVVTALDTGPTADLAILAVALAVLNTVEWQRVSRQSRQ
jgi:low temperature requirement protein LtrA